MCQPIMMDGTTCADPINHDRYIEDYECQMGEGITQKLVKELHLSFPSGHANFAFFSMLYLAVRALKQQITSQS